MRNSCSLLFGTPNTHFESTAFKMDSDMNFSEALLNLIRDGESEKVKEILEDSYLYYTTDTTGVTLLHYSAKYNNESLTRYLLDKGCNVDIQDSKGTTPLMIAVTESRDAIIKILLSAGADILKLNYEQKSALHILGTQYNIQLYALELLFKELQKKCSTSEETAEKLLDAGIFLSRAALLKDPDVLECMLKRGHPIDSTHPVSKITALHVAARSDDVRSVKVILEYGADVNALDNRKQNPLYCVYAMNPIHSGEKIEIMKMLLHRGASPTSYTSRGLFQAYYALLVGNREAVRLLLESGLDFNVKDKYVENTVLHYLAYNTKPGVVDELKLHAGKFNVNARDKYGQTPLLIAVKKGIVRMVKFLLEQGAAADLKHKVLDTTPLYYAYERTNSASEYKYHQCGEMLLQYNADPQFVTVDRNGETHTIFDAALAKEDFNRIKPVVAHLAVLKKLGTPMTETTLAKINSSDSLKEYFYKCQRLLGERISGRVVLFDLLISDKRKMARYLNNEKIARKVRHKSYRRKMLKYWYYYNVLSRRYLEGKRYKKLKNDANQIVCRIFRNRIDKTHVIVDKITDYLNDQSLQNLCNVRFSRSINKNAKIPGKINK